MKDKEVVEVLLRNGAEVNTACEVIPHERRDLIWRNVCEGTRNDMQSMGMTVAMADCIGQVIHG